MAAAGHANGIKGLDYLVREVATVQAVGAGHPGDAAADAQHRDASCAPWSSRCGSTTSRPATSTSAIGAIVSTLLDPSDYFNAWYRKDGPQNYSFWDNEEFNALLPKIDREVDAAKRLALIREAEDHHGAGSAACCRSRWEKINDVWYNYVKGHNPNEYFGIYDVVRFDTFWLGQVGFESASSPRLAREDGGSLPAGPPPPRGSA